MCNFAKRKVSSMKQSVRRIIHKYSLYSTKWQKYPKHGQWYDNMNKRYIKTNYRKSEKLFYFEDALNKSICLWKQKYYATENENLRRVLWLESLRIEDRVYYDIVNVAKGSSIPFRFAEPLFFEKRGEHYEKATKA